MFKRARTVCAPVFDEDRRVPNRCHDDTTLERAASMMRAAGDLERMRILALLLAGECQVSEIAQTTGAELSTTSHRLRVLLSDNLVARRADGRQRFYALADQHVRTLVENILDHADPSVTLKT